MSRPPELVGLGEIADLYGVAKNSAWRWTKREGFPEPVTHVSGRVPVWRRSDVERWVAAHRPQPGRPRQQ